MSIAFVPPIRACHEVLRRCLSTRGPRSPPLPHFPPTTCAPPSYRTRRTTIDTSKCHAAVLHRGSSPTPDEVRAIASGLTPSPVPETAVALGTTPRPSQPWQPTLRNQLDSFLLDAKAAHRTPSTISFYEQKLDPFLAYLEKLDVSEPSDLGARHIRQYMADLAEDHNPGGCAAYWRAIRAFVRFMVKSDVIDKNPMAAIRPPRVDEEPLEPVSDEVVQALLETCESSETGMRDRSLILTLLDTGLRAGEATRLNLGDLDLRDGSLCVRLAKSRKPRYVFLGKASRRALLTYLRTRPNAAGDEPMWLAYHTSGVRDRLTYSGLRDIVRRRAKRAAIKAPSLHSFRRAFAIMMLRAGADIVSLSRMMGHGSLPVLMRYLRQERGDLSQVHHRCSPADHLGGAAWAPA